MQFSSANRTSDPTASGSRPASAEVGDNIQALRDDIASLAESVKHLAAEQLGSSVEDIQGKAKEKVGDLEAAIRRHPSQAALIAAGIGFAVGLILSR